MKEIFIGEVIHQQRLALPDDRFFGLRSEAVEKELLLMENLKAYVYANMRKWL